MDFSLRLSCRKPRTTFQGYLSKVHDKPDPILVKKRGTCAACHNIYHVQHIFHTSAVTLNLLLCVPLSNRLDPCGFSAQARHQSHPTFEAVHHTALLPVYDGAHIRITPLTATTTTPHINTMAESVALELSYGGHSHRMTVPLCSANPKEDLSYELVLARVNETFPKLLNQRWTLVYRDDEGDIVTVSHMLEFDEACQTQLAMNPQDNDGLRTLHFSVLKRVTLHDKLVAPVMQKIMELACLTREAASHVRNNEHVGKGRESFVRLANNAVIHASETISQIRNSEVLGRGRATLGNSAAHTRTLLLSARSEVSTRLRRASSAVAAGIERRRSSSGSASDFDPTEFTKSSIPCTPSATDMAVTVDLRQSAVSGTSAPPEATAEESDDEPPPLMMATDLGDELVSATVYESDTDTLCDDDDRDWDVVNTSGAASGVDGGDKTDGDWSHQLNVIREIIGHVNEELCCDLLSQFDGDVEAVIVELMNM